MTQMQSRGVLKPVSLPGGVELGLIGALLALAAVGWAVTEERMGGMDGGPATDLGALGFWITAWVAMMAAMMLPAISPVVITFARLQRGERARGDRIAYGAMALFVAGYLVVWVAAGLVGYLLIESVRALEIAALSWDEAGPYVAGGVILTAALYQLTPVKDACLRRCRNSLTFLRTSYSPRLAGALRTGLDHGAWCVGSSWALMAALFAVGVMSVTWMAFVAALIAAEKLLPWKAPATRAIAAVLVVLGLGVAVAPDEVPALTIPGSHEAMGAMEGMDGMGAPEPGAGMDEERRGTEAGAGMLGRRMDEGRPGGM
jgi:predicted metal-binding membrane protein